MKIIITGASKGLGKILCESFAKRGDKVGIIARSEHLLKEISENLFEMYGSEVYWRKCDLSDSLNSKSSVISLIEEMGGLDVLINNANFTIKKNILEISSEEWRKSITTGLEASFNSAQTVIPYFIKQGSGHIINIGSLSTKIPLERGCSYSASKYALNGFSKSMVHELHNKGIKVCIIHPGAFTIDNSDQNTWKMPATEVFRACEYVLDTDTKAFVEELTIRPLVWPE